MEKVVTKFLRYVAFDTASDPESQSQPSTNKQFALLDTLKNELEGMGVKEVSLDDNGYLMASISSNTNKKNIHVIILIFKIHCCYSCTIFEVDKFDTFFNQSFFLFEFF